MHRRILEDATLEQLKDFTIYSIDMVKRIDEEVYEDVETCLYKMVYGCHFTKWLLEKALDKMINEDGTKGKHWSVEETNAVAKQYGVEFTHINEYDWNYVMNMMYSDYYDSVPNDISTYVKLSKKFLFDKDAPEGKAFKYYMAMKD